MKFLRPILALFLAAASAAAVAQPLVVRAGRLLDVEQGRYLLDQAIRIDDGRIISVTPWGGGSRGGARLIDWSSYTVLPGLIDLHTHLVGDISSADVAAPLSSSAARDALIAATALVHGMPVVTEVMDPRQVPLVDRYADMFQIGARNMQNFDLLREVGQTQKPVLLKRGMSATVKDLLMSAEYILAEGNPNVVLCERGVRSFEDSTRNMLDLSAVPNVKGQSHLPIIVDPSHATGRPDLIPAMARAAVAAGADGVHVEVHSCPEKALSDGPQALLPRQFAALMDELRRLADAYFPLVAYYNLRPRDPNVPSAAEWLSARSRTTQALARPIASIAAGAGPMKTTPACAQASSASAIVDLTQLPVAWCR